MSINKYYNIRNVVIMQQPYTMQGYHELAKVSKIRTVQNEVLYDKNRCQPLPCWRELIYEQMAHAWRNGPVGDPSHYTSISLTHQTTNQSTTRCLYAEGIGASRILLGWLLGGREIPNPHRGLIVRLLERPFCLCLRLYFRIFLA